MLFPLHLCHCHPAHQGKTNFDHESPCCRNFKCLLVADSPQINGLVWKCSMMAPFLASASNVPWASARADDSPFPQQGSILSTSLSFFKLSPRLHVQSPPCSMTVIMMVTVYVSLSPYTSLGGGTVILLYGWWCKTNKGPPPGQTSKWLGQDSVLRLPTHCDPLTHRNCEHFSQK